MKICAAMIGILAVMSSAAFAHTLHVPFFKDDGDALEGTRPVEGSAGFIAVSNTTNAPITMYVVYEQMDLNGDVVVQEAGKYLLGPGQGISWRPVKESPEEGPGVAVPDMILGFSDSGAARIIWLDAEGGAGALRGRYTEYTDQNAFAHVLLPE